MKVPPGDPARRRNIARGGLTSLLLACGMATALQLAALDAAGVPYSSQSQAAPSQAAAAPPTVDHLAEFLRTAAASITGAFVGAGAAFLANLTLQRRARRIDQVAAGNFAMATLTRQYNGFLNAQRSIQEELVRCKTEAPTVPRWFPFRPIVHFLRADLEFEFKSLTFLFETREVDFFQRLHQVESLQRDLVGHLARLNEIALLKQQRFEAAGFGEDNPSPTKEEVHKAVGARVILDLEAIIEQLEMHADKDGPEYIRAGDALYAALSKYFGAGQRIIRLVGRAPL